MSIKSVMPSNHLILCRPLLLLPSIFPSIRVFSNESPLLIKWPKYWSLSFNISPSNEHPGLISFRMDWLDLLAVQGTVKSLLQHHRPPSTFLQVKEMERRKTMTCPGSPTIFSRKNSDLLTFHPAFFFFFFQVQKRNQKEKITRRSGCGVGKDS